ncbi:MAG: hypothetical protein DWG76_02290 [Chloroflexi bacterium]|nr:hypothetical protein [Chloroflexota bacterium]
MNAAATPSLRLGFVIPRAPFLKDFGPVIQQALDDGHHVVLFYSPEAARGTKASQRVTKRELEPFASPHTELVEFTLETLVQICAAAHPEILITLDGDVGAKDRLDVVQEIQALGVQVVSLASFFETALRPIEFLDRFDKVYYMSEFGADLHFDVQLDGGERLVRQRASAEKYEVVSSPVFDQQRFGDFSDARRELGLPADRKMVLLVAPVVTADTPWRFGVWRTPSKLRRTRQALRQGKWAHLWDIWTGPTFADFVRSVRRFCDHNDALLVVKSRAKHDDPDYLVEAADVYLEGREDVYYPAFTTYQLMAAADLCITAMSLAVAEAVVAGVPVLNVALPYVDKAKVPDHRVEEFNRYYSATFDQAHPSPTNFPGVVNSVSWRRAPEWLASKTFADIPYDETARHEYMQHYLGVTDQSSSQRLLESFLHLISPKKSKQAKIVNTERSL